MITCTLGRALLWGDKVLLFNSRLRLFPSKLTSKWIGPFSVTSILSHGAVEIQALDTGKIFKVNSQMLKLFYEGALVQST
jgi:hypothetical protein